MDFQMNVINDIKLDQINGFSILKVIYHQIYKSAHW